MQVNRGNGDGNGDIAGAACSRASGFKSSGQVHPTDPKDEADCEWSISNFPCSLSINMTPHSMKNLAFHSLLGLRWLYSTNSLYLTYIHFLLKNFCKMYFLSLWVERLTFVLSRTVKGARLSDPSMRRVGRPKNSTSRWLGSLQFRVSGHCTKWRIRQFS